MARELAELRRLVSTPTPATNKTDIVKLDVSSYSGDGDGRLHLNRWFCKVGIAIEARQLSTRLARTRFPLSKLTGKAKEWALGKLVAEASCFPTMSAMKADLRLAFEPPQDERVQRSAFLSLMQGRMSMLEYIQRARHLISCITTHPVDMATQVHVFTSGMNAGYQRFYLTRKTPSTLEEAFAVAVREDYSVTASQAFDVSRVRGPEPEPEPMEIDAIQQFDGRRGATPSTPRPRSSPRGSRPKKCFRCKKPGHRAAVCHAPAPVAANATIENDVAVAGQEKNGDNHDSRLIVISLHVDGATRSVRALLDSGKKNNFVRAESLSVLPADMRVHEGPGHMIVTYADGKPWRLPRWSVSFSYEFDGFQGSDDFLVIVLSGSFDCVFSIPCLARHQPHINGLTRTAST
ncbi:hypothetical protein PC121_g14026 [Phytophthora cactorum]|nr:hypothetical protein PC121_g14026 [Phytophthora cactorum]KAG4046152.1 hypothetical protein PC123_g18447 [Phytophthora cactorum]